MSEVTEDRIETMRTYWTAYGHEPDPVAVATAQLRKRKVEVTRDLREFGLAPAAQERLLEAALGDPNEPIDAPIVACVNAGRWIAMCECGGAEVVDPVTRLFMCASCFNAKHAHQWRLIQMPDERDRPALESALLMRPDERTRNWRPEESLTDLVVENAKYGVMKPGDEIRIEAQPGQEIE